MPRPLSQAAQAALNNANSFIGTELPVTTGTFGFEQSALGAIPGFDETVTVTGRPSQDTGSILDQITGVGSSGGLGSAYVGPAVQGPTFGSSGSDAASEEPTAPPSPVEQVTVQPPLPPSSSAHVDFGFPPAVTNFLAPPGSFAEQVTVQPPVSPPPPPPSGSITNPEFGDTVVVQPSTPMPDNSRGGLTPPVTPAVPGNPDAASETPTPAVTSAGGGTDIGPPPPLPVDSFNGPGLNLGGMRGRALKSVALGVGEDIFPEMTRRSRDPYDLSVGGYTGLIGGADPEDYIQGKPSFREGGMVGPNGAPVRPGQAGLAPPAAPTAEAAPQQNTPPTGTNMAAELNRIAEQYPQQMAQIRQAIMAALQSGELTTQELSTIVHMATVCAQNPAMYPQIRQFAIRNGLATEQDLPPQYDPGLVLVILAAAKSVHIPATAATPTAPSNGAAAEVSMRKGGPVPKPKDPVGKDGVNAVIHEGEYVIPKDVVQRMGTIHFEKLIEKARNPNGT